MIIQAQVNTFRSRENFENRFDGQTQFSVNNSNWTLRSRGTHSAGITSISDRNTPYAGKMAIDQLGIRSTNSSVPISTVNILSPNGGEVLADCDVYNISWESLAASGEYNIDYSVDNGANWISIATLLNANNYDWLVPSNYSPNCLIRVYDANDFKVVDQSDAVFEIKSSITLLPELTTQQPGIVYGKEGVLLPEQEISLTENYTLNAASISTDYT
ncbi:MAG: hypothetical protein AAGA66_10855, partial [Bacteroidota bacterium]